ncbi:MAG: hypothetical protein JJW00_01765, partial [Sulfurimonas sp.]|nr:hypothetical protein [Sulfurimonas sp.]
EFFVNTKIDNITAAPKKMDLKIFLVSCQKSNLTIYIFSLIKKIIITQAYQIAFEWLTLENSGKDSKSIIERISDELNSIKTIKEKSIIINIDIDKKI